MFGPPQMSGVDEMCLRRHEKPLQLQILQEDPVTVCIGSAVIFLLGRQTTLHLGQMVKYSEHSPMDKSHSYKIWMTRNEYL